MNILIITGMQSSLLTTESLHQCHYLIVEHLRACEEEDIRYASVIAAVTADIEERQYDTAFNHQLLRHITDFAVLQQFSCITPVFWEDVKKQLTGDHRHGEPVFYVCGADTERSVLKIAADLQQFGFEVKILLDLCYSSCGEAYHLAGRMALTRILGKEQIIKKELELKPEG